MRLRTLALVSGVYALAFVLDHFLNGSPPVFLLFAATDGSLALLLRR